MGAPGLGNEALNAWYIAGRQVGIGLHRDLPLRGAQLQGRDPGFAAALNASSDLLKQHVADPMAQVQATAPLLDVVEDGSGEPAVRRALEQVELGSLGFRGKHHKNGEHAAGRNRLAVDEAERIGDRVPHAPDALLAAAMAHKPVTEAHRIERTNRAHRPLVVNQAPHDWAGAQG